nr:protease inhibitor I9 family protein [uncultured Capnocytophaga sp.]
MKKFVLIIVGLMLFSCKTTQKQEVQRDTDTLIVLYEVGTPVTPLKEAFAKYGAEILYEYKNINGFAIRIPKEKSLEQAKTHFSKVKGVLSVEKDEKVEINQ